MRHTRGVHASRLPPQAAAPQRRVSIRLLVADHQVIRGPENGGPLQALGYGKTNPGNGDALGSVRMVAQKIAIVPIPHLVAVEIPLPGRSVVKALAVDGGVVEQIAPAT